MISRCFTRNVTRTDLFLIVASITLCFQVHAVGDDRFAIALCFTEPKDRVAGAWEAQTISWLTQQDLLVVDREILAKIFSEHGISASALAQPDSAFQLGAILAADLLVVVETAEGSPSHTLRAIEVNTGVVLSLARFDIQAQSDDVKEWLGHAIIKCRTPQSERIYLAAMSMQADSGHPDEISLAKRVTPLLRLALNRVPAVRLVERERLAWLVRERTMGDVKGDLQGSAAVIQTSVKRLGNGAFEITVLTSAMNDQEPLVYRASSLTDPREATEACVAGVANHLSDLGEPRLATERELKALARERRWLLDQRQYLKGTAVSETLVLLAPTIKSRLHETNWAITNVRQSGLGRTGDRSVDQALIEAAEFFLRENERAVLDALDQATTSNAHGATPLHLYVDPYLYHNALKTGADASRIREHFIQSPQRMIEYATSRLPEDNLARHSSIVAALRRLPLDDEPYGEFTQQYIHNLEKLWALPPSDPYRDKPWHEPTAEAILFFAEKAQMWFHGEDISELDPIAAAVISQGGRDRQIAGWALRFTAAGVSRNSEAAAKAAREILNLLTDDNPENQAVWHYAQSHSHPERIRTERLGELCVEALADAGELADWIEKSVKDAEAKQRATAFLLQPTLWIKALRGVDERIAQKFAPRILAILPTQRFVNRRSADPLDIVIEDSRSLLRAKLKPWLGTTEVSRGPAQERFVQVKALLEDSSPSPISESHGWLLAYIHELEESSDLGAAEPHHARVEEVLRSLPAEHADAAVIRLLRGMAYARTHDMRNGARRLGKVVSGYRKTMPEDIRDLLAAPDPWPRHSVVPVAYKGLNAERRSVLALHVDPQHGAPEVPRNLWVAMSDTSISRRVEYSKLIIKRSPALGGRFETVGEIPALGRPDPVSVWSRPPMDVLGDTAFLALDGWLGIVNEHETKVVPYPAPDALGPVQYVVAMPETVLVFGFHQLLCYDRATGVFEVAADQRSLAPRHRLDGLVYQRIKNVLPDPKHGLIYVRKGLELWLMDDRGQALRQVAQNCRGLRWVDDHLVFTFARLASDQPGNDKPKVLYHGQIDRVTGEAIDQGPVDSREPVRFLRLGRSQSLWTGLGFVLFGGAIEGLVMEVPYMRYALPGYEGLYARYGFDTGEGAWILLSTYSQPLEFKSVLIPIKSE